MAIVQASPHEEPVLLLSGSRCVPFGEWRIGLEQILRLKLDGTPLDRIRVVPPMGGMCVSLSGSTVHVAANGRGYQHKYGLGTVRLPCQLQCGVLTLS